MTVQNNRKKLLIIFGFFLVPLLVAIVWYKFLPAQFRPVKTTNQGDILEQVFTLTPFTHQTFDGQAFTNVEIEKVWTLVHFVNGECDEACSRSLYKTRQLRLTLGNDIARVNRIAIYKSQGDGASNEKMWLSHPNLKVLLATNSGIAEQIVGRISKVNHQQNSVYLIDPLGNVMMHFSQDLLPKQIQKDLKKLLKLSHIG